MSKPLVEKYENMLAQDPASIVFVELARAHLANGDNEKAIAVCTQGLSHHPNSVMGRVLWGKALLQTGKAAPAMQQFDLAAGIEKDNPYAYNLISEVLLRKQLYRSALPFLRKAAALQPNDGRIQQWLGEAKAALAGGPTPTLNELPAVVDAPVAEGGAAPASTTAGTQPELAAVKAPTGSTQPELAAVPPSRTMPELAPVGGPAPTQPATAPKPAASRTVPELAKPNDPTTPAVAVVAPKSAATGRTQPELAPVRAQASPPQAPGRTHPELAQVRPTQPDPQSSSPKRTQPDLAAVATAPPAGDAPRAPPPVGDPDVFSAFGGGSMEEPAAPTLVTKSLPLTPATTKEVPTAATPLGDAPLAPTGLDATPFGGAPMGGVTAEVAISGEATRPVVPVTAAPPVVAGPGATAAAAPRPSRPGPPVLEQKPAPAPGPDPFEALGGGVGTDDILRGLTSTFSALAQVGATGPHPVPAGQPAHAAPVLSPAAAPAAPAARPSESARSLASVPEEPSAQNEIPTSQMPLPEALLAGVAPASAPPRLPADGRMPLLAELPELDAHPAPAHHGDAHRADASPQNTEAIAREYEQELRKKLEANTKDQSFLHKHGLKLGLAAAVLVIAGGLGGSYLYTRHKNQGQSLSQALAKGATAVAADTKEQLELALGSYDIALNMDERSAEAAGMKALAYAYLFADHGRQAAHRQAALQLLERPRVRDERANAALLVDYLLAEPNAAQPLRQKLLSTPLEDAEGGAPQPNRAELHTEAGRIYLADKKYEDAFKHLKRAVDLNPRSVRAMAALGDYYLAFENFEQAADLLGGAAEQLSKFHPGRVVGLAEARLELNKDVAQSLSDFEGLKGNATIPEPLQGRAALTAGRILSANGRHADALAQLSEGLKAFPLLGFEFTMALGEAQRRAGKMDAAQASYEDAIKQEPNLESAKEGLGRVLLARSREKELLERLKPEPDARKVALVRGIAALRLGDAKRARSELLRTKVKDKDGKERFSPEAVVYLSLADAQEESPEKAVATLEALLGRTKRHKATVQVALARVLMQRGSLDKARKYLEEAAKDPFDYDGNAALGELLLNAGVSTELALEPLQRAVERNGSHAPARHLLTRTQLALGRWADAQKTVEAWVADNPTLELAWRDSALVALEMGRAADADTASLKATKDSADPEAFRIRARALFAKGDSRGAFAALERANKLNPKDAETFCEIGNAFVRQGNPELSVEAYKAAVREDAKSHCGRLGPHFAKPQPKGAGKLTPREEVDELVKQATNAFERAHALGVHARVMLEERDFKRAHEVADEAIQTAPASASAWFAVAEVARKQKADDKYLEALLKASQLDQGWSTLHATLADLYLRQGRDKLPDALTQYEAVLATSQNDGDLNRAKKAVLALRKQLRK